MTEIKKLSFTSSNSFNEEERSVISLISTITPDRYNEIVLPDGVDTVNYEKNPVVLLNHNSTLPIGRCLWLKKEATGIKAKTQFADTTLGNDVMKLYRDGFMRAFSIGFIPKVVDTDKEKRLVHKESELLEYSAVTIPANQDALLLSYKSVSSPELRQILEIELKDIEIYEKLEVMKQEIFKSLENYQLKSEDEEVLKALNKVSELEDKINQMNESINQLENRIKKENYQKQIEKKLEELILKNLTNKI